MSKFGAAISESTTVSLAIVCALVSAIIAGSWWAANVSHRLDSIEALVRSGTGDRWTGRDMRAWVHAANQEVEVWSRAAERRLDLPEGAWYPFEFPNPDVIQGIGR